MLPKHHVTQEIFQTLEYITTWAPKCVKKINEIHNPRNIMKKSMKLIIKQLVRHYSTCNPIYFASSAWTFSFKSIPTIRSNTS